MDIKIIVAAHKKYKMPDDSMYIPMQVGAAGKDSIGYMRDDDGDNISYKNDTYSELTAMYYAWKNIDADYLGLVHYRRHFAGSSSNVIARQIVRKDAFGDVLGRDELEGLLASCDMIVPRKRHYYIETLYSHYAHTFDARHLRAAYRIIAKCYPHYLGACNKVYRATSGYMFNMLITNSDLFAKYCEWLFDILGEMERVIDTSGYSDFEKRLYGRVSEILFNVWLEYHKKKGLRVREIRCIHMEPVNWLVKGKAFMDAKLLGRKYDRSF